MSIYEEDDEYILYAGYYRSRILKEPSYLCSNDEDKYTKSNTLGNGKLTNPIALINSDEIAYAGGIWYYSDGSTDNTKYFLYTSEFSWMLTPNNYSKTNNRAYHDLIYPSSIYPGSIAGNAVNISPQRTVVPVLSLISETKISSGTGTYDNSYVVSVD